MCALLSGPNGDNGPNVPRSPIRAQIPYSRGTRSCWSVKLSKHGTLKYIYIYVYIHIYVYLWQFLFCIISGNLYKTQGSRQHVGKGWKMFIAMFYYFWLFGFFVRPKNINLQVRIFNLIASMLDDVPYVEVCESGEFSHPQVNLHEQHSGFQ